MKLIRYKKTHQKIAMGFLSYIPGDYSVKQLQDILSQYEADEAWELFLVKEEDDFIGIVGAELAENNMTVHHLSLNPSFRGEGYGKEVVTRLQEEYPDKTPFGNEYTESFISKCILQETRAER